MLEGKRPAFKQMYAAAGNSGRLFGDDDAMVEGDVELHNHLALVPAGAVAPSATSSAVRKLVLAANVKVSDLVGTSLHDLAVAFYGCRSDIEVDRRELAAQELFTKWANSVSEFITAADDGNGETAWFRCLCRKGWSLPRRRHDRPCVGLHWTFSSVEVHLR